VVSLALARSEAAAAVVALEGGREQWTQTATEAVTAAEAAVAAAVETADMDVKQAGAYTRSLLSSTSAVLVTHPRVPLSN